jgi:hypothetical protein
MAQRWDVDTSVSDRPAAKEVLSYFGVAIVASVGFGLNGADGGVAVRSAGAGTRHRAACSTRWLAVRVPRVADGRFFIWSRLRKPPEDIRSWTDFRTDFRVGPTGSDAEGGLLLPEGAPPSLS